MSIWQNLKEEYWMISGKRYSFILLEIYSKIDIKTCQEFQIMKIVKWSECISLNGEEVLKRAQCSILWQTVPHHLNPSSPPKPFLI